MNPDCLRGFGKKLSKPKARATYNMELIEKLVLGIEPSKGEIQHELYEICDRVHSGCNGECPVYRLNGSSTVNPNKPFAENRGCDCFKSGREMYIFIKNAHKGEGE